MVYSNNFVVAIKVNGTAQKELKDGSVIIPFESEYTIHLRNKNRTRNAVAYVYIDGDLVTPTGVVVYKNDFVDLERSTDKAVKFKFVSLQTPEAIEFGKDTENSDKGMGVIEVRWHYEKEQPKRVYTPPIIIREDHHHHHHYLRHRPLIGDPIWCNNLRGNAFDHVTYGASASLSAQSSIGEVDSLLMQECDVANVKADKAMDGCTVEGGYSSQTFREVNMDIESDFTTIRLVLKGTEPAQAVRTANAQPRGRKVYGDRRSQPNLETSGFIAGLGSDVANLEEDPRIKDGREELIRLELELIAAKRAKLQAELDALNNS